MSKIAITGDFKIDESDLKDLAWSWYFATQEIEYISSKNALAMLTAIVGAYVRGCGVNMGNHEGFDRHSDRKVILMNHVLAEAFDKYPETNRFKEAYRNSSFSCGRDFS